MIVDDVRPSPLPGDAAGCLDRFRTGLYSCLSRRGDALFELVDAVACAPGPVTDLARLCLEDEHQRGHGALYDGLNSGAVDAGRLRCLACSGPLPRIAGPDGRGRLVLAVDVSNWLRPDAAISPERSFCHTYARGAGQAQMIPSVAVLLRLRARIGGHVLDGPARRGQAQAR